MRQFRVSFGPEAIPREDRSRKNSINKGLRWWAHKGSNLGPLPCEGNALPLSYAPGRPVDEARACDLRSGGRGCQAWIGPQMWHFASSISVMAGLDPAIHVFSRKGSKTWITGHRRAEATPFFRTAMPGDDGGECPGSLLPQGRLWSRIALDTPAPRFVNRTLLALTRDGRAHSSAGERSLHTGEVQGSIPCAPTMPSMKSVA